MRKLVLLVCILGITVTAFIGSPSRAGIIPSLESPSGKLGFYPITNEISIYHNFDDAGKDRGETIQIISINSFNIFTSFNFEFTGDFNYDMAGGYDHDHYIELSLVKPVTGFVSINVQRIISTFEDEPVNQVGVRFSF